MAAWLESLEDNIVVDKSKCVFCMICVDRCILDNLRFKASPCRDACPLGLNCQGYAQLIARGQEQKALEVILETLPFPRILGRICSTPCEDACSRTSVDGKGVALRALKRYLGDCVKFSDGKDGLEGWVPKAERPERVAIIGGGPAGVMASCHLRREGYQVILLDAGSKLGGMLTQCIPEFRLPTQVTDDELSVPAWLGVEFRLGETVDAKAFLRLVEGFDAVLVATGAGCSKKLGISGGDLPGVIGAVELLDAARSGKPLTVGQRVIVIGGGNTAIDSAQTALRMGAEEVTIVCLESREAMPAFEGEVRDALEEGIRIENSFGPTCIVSKDDRVDEVKFDRCLAVFDESGNFSPRFAPGEGITKKTDMVIMAIGQESDLGFLNGSGVEVERGRIVVDSVSLQTSVDKVFSAGDVVTGPKSVVEAMAQGMEAAESIHRYLQRMPLRYGRRDEKAAQVPADSDTSKAIMIKRLEPPRLAIDARSSFKEIEGAISKEQAIGEAERCLSCGEPFGKHRTCWSCLACEVDCPEKAINVKVPYLMR